MSNDMLSRQKESCASRTSSHPYDVVRLVDDHHAVGQVEGKHPTNVRVHNVIVWHENQLGLDHDQGIAGQVVGTHLEWE